MASSSASSSSSACYSSVAGLHGGNYYDLTADDNDDDHGGGGGVRMARRRISTTVMDDDGRAIASSGKSSGSSSSMSRGGGAAPPATSMMAQTQQKHSTSRTGSDSRQRSVSIIDPVNDSDDDEAIALNRDVTTKKRSLPLHPPPPPQQIASNNNQWKDSDEGEVVVAGNSSFSSSTSCFNRHSMRKKRLVMPPSSSSSTTTTACVSNNVHHREQQQQQQQEQVTIPTISTSKSYINLPSRTCPRDGATITFGLLSLIDIVLKEKEDRKQTTILTCEGSDTSSRNKLLNNSTTAEEKYHRHRHPYHHLLSYYNHQPFHYLQHDNWSCGYRNLQMLLSSLMPTLLHHSTSSSCASFSQGVPCIEEIQRTTETLWRQGYDIRNALHHEYKLVGKKTWIGAVEVWSYLSFMRIDSIIVQFIKTSQNRALLGRFAWAYFNRACHTFGCSCCQSSSGHRKSRLDGAGSGGVEGDPPPLASPILTSLEYADHLLREVTKPNNVVVDDFHQPQHRCQCSIPPLYLQWEGHSVTVVGIKRMKCDNIVHGHRTTSSSSSSPDSFSLIIFCPQKNVANVKSALTKEFHSNNAVAAAVYKSDVTIESKKGNTTNNSNNSILELPVTTLLHKDCQILLTTGRTIDEAESKRRTVCSNKVGFLNAVATA